MKVLTCGSCNATNEALREALDEANKLFEAIRQVSINKNVREACEEGVAVCTKYKKKDLQ